MEKSIGFRVTVEFDCPEILDEKTFHDEYDGDPMTAYKVISNNLKDSPLNFSEDDRIVKVELLGSKTGEQPKEGETLRYSQPLSLTVKYAQGESLQFRRPLRLTVKYALAFHFRDLVEQIQDCEVKNVIEIKSGELLQYWINCPKEKENEITDMAFATWIRNPIFQKYYHNTKEFKEIADKYVSEYKPQ